jgi:hypothetical protein
VHVLTGQTKLSGRVLTTEKPGEHGKLPLKFTQALSSHLRGQEWLCFCTLIHQSNAAKYANREQHETNRSSSRVITVKVVKSCKKPLLGAEVFSAKGLGAPYRRTALGERSNADVHPRCWLAPSQVPFARCGRIEAIRSQSCYDGNNSRIYHPTQSVGKTANLPLSGTPSLS